METFGLTDVHVHLLALPTASNGCLISPRLKNSPLARLLAWRRGWPFDDPEKFNRLYLETLTRDLSASARVAKAVLLAMDGVYDSSGRLDEGKTDILISNRACLNAAKSDPRLIAGVSINPRRRDAIDELEKCAEEGVGLVKWLPNSQGFDPADPLCRPFYRKLAGRNIPLLSHSGLEFSLLGKDQSAGDISRLRAALEEGVTVIAAHGASYGCFVYEKYFDDFLNFVKTYPHFYADVSALTLPNRAAALFRISRHPEVWDRLVFGTDYPLPVFAYPVMARRGVRAYQEVWGCSNPFDRQALVLEKFGIKLRPNLL